MLQSEFHNPNCPEKMSFEAFCKLGKNIPGYKKFLNQQKLDGFYRSITKISLSDFNAYMKNYFTFKTALSNNINNSLRLLK